MEETPQITIEELNGKLVHIGRSLDEFLKLIQGYNENVTTTTHIKQFWFTSTVLEQFREVVKSLENERQQLTEIIDKLKQKRVDKTP